MSAGPPAPPPEGRYVVVTGPRRAPAACALRKIAASSSKNPHSLTAAPLTGLIGGVLTGPPRTSPSQHRRGCRRPCHVPLYPCWPCGCSSGCCGWRTAAREPGTPVRDWARSAGRAEASILPVPPPGSVPSPLAPPFPAGRGRLTVPHQPIPSPGLSNTPRRLPEYPSQVMNTAVRAGNATRCDGAVWRHRFPSIRACAAIGAYFTLLRYYMPLAVN